MKKGNVVFQIVFVKLLIVVSLLLGVHTTFAKEIKNDTSPKVLNPGSLYLQIKDPQDRLFFNALARPDGKDMVYHIKGKAYAYVPGDIYKSKLNHGAALFGIEGYNIRKAVQIEGTNDVIVLTREIVFYTDLKTGEILEKWTNPITGKTYPVSHIENDHVNFHYRVEDGKLKTVINNGNREIGAFPIAAPESLGDLLVYHADAFPLYNLNERYNINDSMNLKNETYTSAEFFDFLVSDKYVNQMKGNQIPKGSVPFTNSWTRVSPWTPWMGLDENEYAGNLTFHARSEVLDGFDDLPEWIKEEVKENYPLYTSSLDSIDSSPNATSWTSFYESVLKPINKTWKEWLKLYP
ncbi:DUF1838 family protein [Solibacillus sp. CAU 1738]|uniref:DUF1838 family protein n=1 Tax=Solibacillus sp. CAU 1738 TaxID=3140363 RepID=UPI0032610D1E